MSENNPYIKEWDEAIRLFHKFCPESKSLIHGLKELTMDNVFMVMAWIDATNPGPRVLIDSDKDDLEILKLYFNDQMEHELERVLVIPDVSWKDKRPFICSKNRLYEKIEDGAEVDNRGHKSRWKFIDGCSDVLFIFETSGKILLFDHHEGFSQATPGRWKKK